MRATLAVLLILIATGARAQVGFIDGDIVATGADFPGATQAVILQYAPDGTLRRTFASSTTMPFYDPLVFDGRLIVPTFGRIIHFDAAGNLLGTLADINLVEFLAPTGDGKIVASSASGDAYVLDGAGNILRQQDPGTLPGGIDVGPDHCTTYFAHPTRFGTWNACTGGPAVAIGPDRADMLGRTIRVLSDGTLLIAHESDVIHVDAAGNLLRSYGLRGIALALDRDGVSFWTAYAHRLTRLNIETGAVITSFEIPYTITFMSIVGEPRVAVAAAGSIPTTSSYVLMMLALALAVVGITRLRLL